MTQPHPASARQREGVLLCVLAAGGYGTMAVLAKLAYAAGVGVTALLSLRFALAAALLWWLAARAGAGQPSRTALAWGLALGGGLYAAESGAFFASLERLDVSLAELTLFTYPALVAVGAAALGRERLSAGRVAALTLSLAGVALVVAGRGTGAVDVIGVLLALGAAAGYAAYLLGSDGALRGGHPLTLSAAVCTGAAISFTTAGAATGSLDAGFGAEGWAAIAAMVVIATVVPLTAVLAGMARIGAPSAAIISTLEPLVTVGLAFIVLGDRLAPLQLAGAALVLAGVVLAARRSAPAGSRIADRGAPPVSAPHASARPLAEQPA